MADVCKSFVPTSGSAGRKEELLSSSTSGLPSQFINSMKTLFNILDDAGQGMVPLSEIERRWRDDAVPNLPGVLDSLRTVVPPNGMLTFDTFVWGLRTALKRARQHRGKVASSKYNNFTGNTKNVAPPHHFHRSLNGDQITGFNAVQSNGFRSNSQMGKHYSEALRNGEYQHQQPNWIENNDSTFGRYQFYPQQQQYQSEVGARVYYQGNDERGISSRHRRSSSGPISTAATLPTTWSKNFANTAEVKYTKMGFATKFSAQENKNTDTFKSAEDCQSDCSNEKRSLKAEKTNFTNNIKLSDCANQTDASDSSPEPKFPTINRMKTAEIVSETTAKRCQQSDFDAITAKTLVKESNKSVKCIGQSGRHVGLTGSMQRNSSTAAAGYYGSLRRPAMSVPAENTMSASGLHFPGYVNTDRRRSKRGSRNRHKVEMHRRQYASAGESGDESHHHVIYLSKQDSAVEAAKSTGGRFLKGGDGNALSGACSPQEFAKSSSDSSSPELKESYNGRCKDQEKESESDLVTSDDVSHDEKPEPRQLLQPPPPGRSGRIYDGHVNCTNAVQGSTDNNIPHYATIGRRRSNNSKRRDPRRHTVANGIDYSMLKCIKQIDEEKEVLCNVIDHLDRNREWFKCRLAEVEENRKILTSVGMTSGQTDEHETKLLQTKKQLFQLVERFSEMSKAVAAITTSKNEEAKSDDMIASSLKEQNIILSKEVLIQTDRIKKLEREKSMLVQQLFNAKAASQIDKSPVNTSIFI